MFKFSLMAFFLATLVWSCGDGKKIPTSPPNHEEDIEKSPTSGGEVVSHNWDLSRTVPLDSVRAFKPDAKLFVRTAFGGESLEDFEVKFVAVVDGELPDISLIMLEASDPRLVALGGAAQGMSGSPVFCEQGVVGALAYGFDMQNHPPYYFMATPLEAMINGIFRDSDTVLKAGKMASINGNKLKPLSPAFLATGVSSRLVKHLEANSSSYSQIVGSLVSNVSSASRASDFEQKFEPGSPLAVALLVGDDVNMAAVGTVTYTTGNKIIGFGHPFTWLGPVEYPIIGAKVLVEISNLFSPFKFAVLNSDILGVITADRLPGIGGALGREPEMIELATTAKMNGENFLWKHRLTESGPPDLQAFAGMVGLFGPMVNRVDDVTGSSFRVSTRIIFKDYYTEVYNTRLYAWPGRVASELLFTAADEYAFGTYLPLVFNRELPLQPKEVIVTIEMVDSLLVGQIAKVKADTLATAGDVLPVGVMLKVGLLEERWVNFEIALPDTFPPGVYNIEVGPGDMIYGEPFPEGEFERVWPDTNISYEPTLEELLQQINSEDKKTILQVRLNLRSPDVPDEPVYPVYPPPPTPYPGLGTEKQYGEMESDTPEAMVIPPPIAVTQPTGLVITGSRARGIRLKNKK
ncbi:MAG: SpoIVB peptidase S55 domain-containing protein [Minisyncoccia bacterium]